MRKVSTLDIRQSYPAEKARIDLVSHLWIHLVLRPISFRLTPLFINAGFTANAVTAVGFVVLTVGLAFLVLGAYSYCGFIIGAALVNVWALLDCIDGDIARFQKMSKFGALFDFLTGFMYHSFLCICLGIGLYLVHGRFGFGASYRFPSWFFLVTGVLESLCGMFRKVVSLQSQSIAGKQAWKQGDSRITIWTVLPRAILSFKEPLLMIASLVGALGLFLFGYAVYNLVTLLAMIALSLRKMLLVDRQQFEKGKDL